jgi:HEAT repeat protein
MRIADKEAVPELIRVLQNDELRAIRAYAAEALGALEDERAIQPLMNSLSDEDPLVQGTAMTALENLAGPSILPKINELLSNDGSGSSD